MMIDIEKITSNKFFEGVSRVDLENLGEDCFETAKFNPGDIIVSQNADSDQVFLIVGGKVKVMKAMPDGKEVFLAQREKKEFFGELGLLENRPRSANIYAEDQVELVIISKENFFDIIDKIPKVKDNVTQSISERWRKSDHVFTLLFDNYKKISAQKKELEKAKQKIEEYSQRLKIANEELMVKNEQLYHIAVTDKLTNVYNRAYIMDYLTKEYAKSKRHKLNLSCILIDIDKFKDFNDKYGHLIGDLVLKKTAQEINDCVRKEDVFGRYGGEEFLIILPNTNLDQAEILAEKVRMKIAKTEYRNDDLNLKVTISLGVADIGSAEVNSEDDLLKNADLALYQAKDKGRNCTVKFRS